MSAASTRVRAAPAAARTCCGAPHPALTPGRVNDAHGALTLDLHGDGMACRAAPSTAVRRGPGVAGGRGCIEADVSPRAAEATSERAR